MSAFTRIATTWLLILAAVCASATARAEVSVEACADAYTSGQEERLALRLLHAHSEFIFCADTACPEAIVRDCKRWAAEVEAALPSIRVRVSDDTGGAIDSLTFSVDGATVPAEQLEGPILVDTGRHVLRLEAPGYIKRRLVQAVGAQDHSLPLTVTMQRIPKPLPEAPRHGQSEQEASRRLPLAAITMASAAALALGGAVYFGLSAAEQYRDLNASCAPNCSPQATRSVHSKAVISDVMLASSVVAFGAAAFFYFEARRDQRPATALGIEPNSDGARLRLRVAF